VDPLAMGLRASIPECQAAFANWLVKHPVPGDQLYGSLGVKYQVARYCDYLGANRWPGGDPLKDQAARDGAVNAYRIYLDVFNTPTVTIDLILASLDRFYVFLGLGRVAPDVAELTQRP
jgi:hypothetical protein